MAKQNAYLAKQEAVQRQCFNDGWKLGTQQMCDYISLALRDPETMGYDGSEWWEFKTIPKEPRWGGHAFSCDLGIGATG